MKFQDFDSRKGFQCDHLLIRQSFLVYIFAYAARGVSTHHGFGAVCIEYTHTEIRFLGCSNQYQTVCTDTGMISAPFSGGFYRILQRRRQGIYIDIIIAGSLHLGELDSCCHFD
jgi:hypothetical protein